MNYLDELDYTAITVDAKYFVIITKSRKLA